MRKPLILSFIIILVTVGSVSGKTSDPNPVGAIGSSRDWDIIFNENFNTLDASKWTSGWFGTTSNHPFTKPANELEKNCYNSNNVNVANGILTIKVTANNDPRCVTLQNTQANYQGGILHTNGKFSLSRGYIEARMWLPPGVENGSVWSQFWTLGQIWPQHGEIDVLEAYGTDRSCSYHYHYSGGVFGGNSTVVGSTSGWHTYGAFWQDGRVTWYYDGIQIATTTNGVVNMPHYLVLALATIGTQVAFPSELKFEYVRAWQEGTAPVFTPTATSTSPVKGTPAPTTLTPVATLPTKSR